MIIRCWGARGSIPTSGKQYLRYGGNTTCLEIRNNRNDILLVDAGSGIREAGNAFLAEGRQDFTLLLTHAHWDHIMGFPFFKPLYHHDTRITVWGCTFAQESIRDMLARVMTAPYFPIKYDDVHARISYEDICAETYAFGDMMITPVALSHPNQGTGFKFSENGRSFVFLTDNELGLRHDGGLAYEDYREFCRGADLLIHDAEYRDEEYPKKRGWGHSTIEQAVSLALDAGVPRLGLFHHNQDRVDDEVDDLVAACKRIIRERQSALSCFAVHQGMDLAL
ncbi:MAG: MBL fold metallo-hydrolase [Smithellaceae bacterium]|nr:MBL fold metallo-hydrolase [Syntrophaceae bacterium]MDD4241928.1 MBL fold metallo-hydrolase [Smithellaceae bacterium]NLX50890.1 MBL fold metallo-hydrolase [Deltaproteobacteria bacterium]